jgi:hypothetical protein
LTRDEPGVLAWLAKLRRGRERWTEREKALAHIHLAYASPPHCEEVRALRLFIADELLKLESRPPSRKE